jgi:hypothetical protein
MSLLGSMKREVYVTSFQGSFKNSKKKLLKKKIDRFTFTCQPLMVVTSLKEEN